MDLLSLRNTVETRLVDVLGTYRLANGALTTALSVRSQGEGLPPGTTVSGIECVIIRDPELIPVSQYESQQAFSRWTIYLINWDSELDLGVLGRELLSDWPGAGFTTVPTVRGAGPRAVMRIGIQTDPVAACDW